MDNVCHTLAGAAFGEAGLKRHTRFGAATLMIASNLPDIDALVFATELPSVAIRRGWTHGVLAQALLPVALAGVMLLADRAWRRGPGAPAARFVPLLALSYVGVLAHIYMDLLNNYGVRLLMPFANRWFYGDAVFIIDVWLWLAFGLAVWLARRHRRVAPARRALLVAAVYIAALVMSARASRAFVLAEWQALRGRAPQALMVGPVPITPFTRTVIVDAGEHYETGTFTWMPRRVVFDEAIVPKNDRHPAVLEAKQIDRRIQAVLVWARFPYYEVARAGGRTTVTVRDMRFGERVGSVTASVAASASRDSAYPADPSRSSPPSRTPSTSRSR